METPSAASGGVPRVFSVIRALGLHRAERADHRKDARHAAAGGRGGFHTLLLWNS